MTGGAAHMTAVPRGKLAPSFCEGFFFTFSFSFSHFARRPFFSFVCGSWRSLRFGVLGSMSSRDHRFFGAFFYGRNRFGPPSKVASLRKDSLRDFSAFEIIFCARGLYLKVLG